MAKSKTGNNALVYLTGLFGISQSQVGVGLGPLIDDIQSSREEMCNSLTQYFPIMVRYSGKIISSPTSSFDIVLRYPATECLGDIDI
jgi:hypothetical protein